MMTEENSESGHETKNLGVQSRIPESVSTPKVPDQAGTKEEIKPFVSHAPALFAVVIGLAYATGFLIVSTYLGSFGIQESTSDILRIKYLQVGFYFLLFFGTLVVLILTLTRAILQKEDHQQYDPSVGEESKGVSPPRATDVREPQARLAQRAERMNPLSLPIWIEFVLAIYLTVGFAEPSQTGRQSLP
jgi:hypothetical protein